MRFESLLKERDEIEEYYYRARIPFMHVDRHDELDYEIEQELRR